MRSRQILGLAATVALLAAAATAQIHDPRALAADPATAEGPIAPILLGLGDHHMAVTTDVPASQLFFDQGLRLTYGFNHSEALRAFKEAARLDPGNAMAWWGQALVLGPNLNLPMVPEVAPQAYAEGYTLEGLAHLERAVRLEDGLLYNEPPDWYFPVRHFLGAMLMDAGRPDEAEVVYAADLRRNPENGHSLFGLERALAAQGKIDDAAAVGERFARAWADADVQLTSSRY